MPSLEKRRRQKVFATNLWHYTNENIFLSNRYFFLFFSFFSLGEKFWG